MQETYQDLEVNDRKIHLYGWVITYNPYVNLYLATTRDHYDKMFSDVKNENVIKSSSISSLEEMIINNEGDLQLVIDYLNKI